MLQGISLKKRVRERKKKRKTWGDQASSVSEAHNFIFKRNFYILTCTEREMKDARSCGISQTLQQFCPYQNRIFFCIPFPQTMLCPLSSGLGGQWTFYDPLLIKAAQPENLFSLEVFFFFIFPIYISLRKYQTELHSHGAKVQ